MCAARHSASPWSNAGTFIHDIFDFLSFGIFVNFSESFAFNNLVFFVWTILFFIVPIKVRGQVEEGVERERVPEVEGQHDGHPGGAPEADALTRTCRIFHPHSISLNFRIKFKFQKSNLKFNAILA